VGIGLAMHVLMHENLAAEDSELKDVQLVAAEGILGGDGVEGVGQ